MVVGCPVVLAVVGFAAAPIVSAHGSFHEELARIDALIREAPEDAGLWHQRGWLHLLHGDWEQTLLDVERAGRMAPGRFPPGYVQGKALAAGGKLVAARAVLGDYLKQHPEHGAAWLERARVLQRMGLAAQALPDFRMALAKIRNPEPDLYIELARILVECARSDEAVRVLDQGISRLGRIPSLALKAIEIDAARGMLSDALSRIALMQKSAPRPEPWMAQRARILERAGRHDEALSAWKDLVEHIAALPAQVRSAHAVSVFLEEAMTESAMVPSSSRGNPASNDIPAR